MNPLKIVAFFWIGLVVIVFAFGIFSEGDVTVTGNIPLTGVLNEELGQEFVSPELNISFFVEDKDIYKIRDVEYFLHFTPSVDIKMIVDVTHIITDANGDIRFYDEDTLTISEEVVIEGSLDIRKAQGIILEEGEYTYSIRISYGDVEEGFFQKFKLQEIPEWLYSLKQLFDIKMEIDDTILDSSEELEVRVIFESFGSEATPVDLVFFVYDMNDEEIFKRLREIVIETEGVVVERFEGFDAPPGEYVVVLRTLYNIDIEDYFEQKIVILDKLDILPFIVIGGILVFAAAIMFLSTRKRK